MFSLPYPDLPHGLCRRKAPNPETFYFESTTSEFKQNFPELCLKCQNVAGWKIPYSSDGHDGLGEKWKNSYDETLVVFSRMSLARGRCRPWISSGPSDMDGWGRVWIYCGSCL